MVRRFGFLFSTLGFLTAVSTGNFQAYDQHSFDWSSMTPAANPSWQECYSFQSSPHSSQYTFLAEANARVRRFSCARLELPLDYHNNTDPRRVSVPLLRISAPPSSSHRGTIVTAFGGAGNSRILDLVNIASNTELLDEIDPNLQYDFVTFDNRGFGYSDPAARCFESVLDAKLWEGRATDLGGVMSSDKNDMGLLARYVAAGAKGQLCSKQNGDFGGIMAHMTTAYAARDMLEIINILPDHDKQQKSREIPKLKFLGLSYGTMVGQTFASLYPEHVSRMILDGTVLGEDWTGKWQMQHLLNTDAVWESFYEDCYEAKGACPLWRAFDADSTAIERRVDDFLDDLRRKPSYVTEDDMTRLVTYRDVKAAIYWTTMAPRIAAPVIASALNRLIEGDTNITLEFPFEDLTRAMDCPSEESPDSRASYNKDAGLALNCGDAEGIANSTIGDFREYLSFLEGQSSVAAFIQGERKIRCMGWSIQPAWRFSGPFTSRIADGGSSLATPLLILSNRLDPMTSREAASRVAEAYPGSIVLEQNSRGHTVLGNSALHPCTTNHLRAYLRDGTLPKPGTTCGEECNLFNGLDSIWEISEIVRRSIS